jgi:hypothetical protein
MAHGINANVVHKTRGHLKARGQNVNRQDLGLAICLRAHQISFLDLLVHGTVSATYVVGGIPSFCCPAPRVPNARV